MAENYKWQDYQGMTDTGRAIGRKVEMVKRDPAQIGVLSTGERIAVALVLDRPDLFPHGGYKILEAVDRLGDEWLQAAIIVQKAMNV